jgi:putative transposase
VLEPSKYYHIFNRANGWEKMFFTDENYTFFISKFQYYISPVADIYAYCLIPNHLHFLLKIKSEKELIDFFWSDEKRAGSATSRKSAGPETQRTFEKFVSVEPKQTFGKFAGVKGEKVSENQLSLMLSKQFSKFFSCYTQSFNKVFKRKGSLFIPNFKRKEITSEDYLQQVIVYIHSNPVKHSLTNNLEDWKYSSYHDIISDKSDWIKSKKAIEIFENLDNFKFVHQNKSNYINAFLIEDPDEFSRS